jgi:hypothetical protein
VPVNHQFVRRPANTACSRRRHVIVSAAADAKALGGTPTIELGSPEMKAVPMTEKAS